MNERKKERSAHSTRQVCNPVGNNTPLAGASSLTLTRKPLVGQLHEWITIHP